MSYQIEISDNFKKEAKKLFKKYPSLYSEIAQLIKELKENPRMGTHLGADIYQIRIAIASKGRGKSGGGRVLTYVEISGNVVLLFSIYSKGEKDSLSDAEIEALLKMHLE